MVETPVLFITFARPDYARQTWEGIKVAKPKTLYFYSNKGRTEKEGEVERNNEIRSYINEIDWECDLHTFFREECVNVYDSLRGAIDWLFIYEEKGIILEEDCVPTKAFFSFIDQMIVKFSKEKRVWCISGDNFIDESLIGEDYYFSHYHYMYGWATWRDRWCGCDWNLTIDKNSTVRSCFRDIYKTRQQVSYRVKELRKMSTFIDQTKCWDYLWGYLMDREKALTVHPKYHLITNIGLSGTHHEGVTLEGPINKRSNPKSDIYSIDLHPKSIEADLEADRQIFKLLQYIPFHKNVVSCLRYRIPLYYNKLFHNR